MIHRPEVSEIYMGIEEPIEGGKSMSDRLLEVRALDAHYGDFQALFGVSMRVTEGEVVAVIGANGAGKSTLLKCIAGAMRARPNMVLFHGVPIGGEPTHDIVARGIALVPEGRRLFPSLTVEENLLIGGQLGRRGPWTLKRVYELFPMLAGAPPPARAVAVRGPATDGRHRARADVESNAAVVRRDQPGACSYRDP